MIDYLKKESWKGRRTAEMAELEFSRADSVFIFTDIKGLENSAELLFAESLAEAAGYFAFVYLDDLIVDALDAQRLDYAPKREEHLSYLLSFGALRLKLINAAKTELNAERLKEITDEFCSIGRHEFRLLVGAKELKFFLAERYGASEVFSLKRLQEICLENNFSGAELKDFFKTLTNE